MSERLGLNQVAVTRVRPPVPLDRWPGALPRPERFVTNTTATPIRSPT
jgi:hypothetical protein